MIPGRFSAMSEIKERRPQGLDPPLRFGDIAAARRREEMAQGRRIVWQNVLTVISAAILIGAEVFGAAFAASWAIATLADLGSFWARILDVIFVICGVVVRARGGRGARRGGPGAARAGRGTRAA